MSVERRVLLAMCGLITINQLGFGSVIPVLPLYAQSFGVPASAIGMAVAIYGLARFLVAVPSGRIADWLGRRPTLAIGGIISSAGSFWCAAATDYPEFIVARFVSGAGAGIILTAGQVVLADISSPERRGRIIAIYQGCFLFAVGIGPLPGGILATHYGLAAPFQAYGAASLLAMAVAWFAVKESKGLGHGGAGAGGLVEFSFIRQIGLLTKQIGYILVSIVALTNAITNRRPVYRDPGIRHPAARAFGRGNRLRHGLGQRLRPVRRLPGGGSGRPRRPQGGDRAGDAG